MIIIIIINSSCISTYLHRTNIVVGKKTSPILPSHLSILFYVSSCFELTIAAPPLFFYIRKSIYKPKLQADASRLSSLDSGNRKVGYELLNVGKPTPYSRGESPQSVGGAQVIAPYPGSSTAIIRALILNHVPRMLDYVSFQKSD